MEEKMNKLLLNKRVLFHTMIVCLSFFLVACKKDEGIIEGPKDTENYHSTLLDKPTIGTPSDYSAKENLYIANKLVLNTKHYKTISTGTVKAKVLFVNYSQSVNNIKIVNDEEVFTQAISYSMIKKVGVERFISAERYFTCQAESIEAVDKATWKDKIEEHNKDDFLSLYGATPFGLSIYRFTDETIIDSELLSYQDGVYNYQYVLDPNQSTELYKYELRTMSGASDFPEFISITYEVMMDEKWRVLEVKISENYRVDIFGEITCTGVLTEKFEYSQTTINIPGRNRYEVYL